jgi:hypothetical protein
MWGSFLLEWFYNWRPVRRRSDLVAVVVIVRAFGAII